MDAVTHALLGAKLGWVAAPCKPRLQLRERLGLGAAAAVFPDVDFVGFLFDPLAFLARWHQGPTHSLVLLPVWALAMAGAFAALKRRGDVLPEALLVCALGLASHVAADFITVYGTALFFPLSDERFALGTTFVIDPLFTAIVAASLAWGVHSGGRSPAALGLTLICLYVGLQALLRETALSHAQDWARAANVPAARVDALPQPFSPFNWKLIVASGTTRLQAHANLLGHPPLLPLATARSYRPLDALEWERRELYGAAPDTRPLVATLWQDPRLADFRRFAAHPALSRIDAQGGAICVWFTDLRYDLPALPDTFRYGLCRDGPEAPWGLFRLRYFSQDARVRVR
jgi:inner membrane protein